MQALEDHPVYRRLLCICFGDRERAKRLVDHARQRHPDASEEVLVAIVIEEWQRDAR